MSAFCKRGFVNRIDASYAFSVYSNNDQDARLAPLSVVADAITAQQAGTVPTFILGSFILENNVTETTISVAQLKSTSRFTPYPPVNDQAAMVFFQSIWIKSLTPSTDTSPGQVVIGHPASGTPYLGTYEIRL